MNLVTKVITLILAVCMTGCYLFDEANYESINITGPGIEDNFDTIRENNSIIAKRQKEIEQLRTELDIETDIISPNKDNSGYMYAEPSIGVYK